MVWHSEFFLMSALRRLLPTWTAIPENSFTQGRPGQAAENQTAASALNAARIACSTGNSFRWT